LCEKFDYAPSEQLKKEIEIVANGLILLCDVCKVDGCIARGVGDDGISHPPVSSIDQFCPWVLGLWRLINCPVSDERWRNEIKARLVRTISGVRASGWQIPTEWEGEVHGEFGKSWRGVSKQMLAAAVGRELGVVDEQEFKFLLDGRPDGSIYTRKEIMAQGFAPEMIRYSWIVQFWIFTCAQLCARELCRLDASNAEHYKRGLVQNGAAATEYMYEFETYISRAGKPISYDWRVLLDDVHPWSNKKEAMNEAARQINYFFGTYSPGMRDEKNYLGQALFAAWIAIASGDKVAANAAYKALTLAVEKVNWADCGYSFAFVAEAAIYTYENLKS
jgi:hypothetical protein